MVGIITWYSYYSAYLLRDSFSVVLVLNGFLYMAICTCTGNRHVPRGKRKEGKEKQMTITELQDLTLLLGGIDERTKQTQQDVCEIKGNLRLLSDAGTDREKRLITLETEHKNRLAEGDCPVTNVAGFKLNKKQVGITALVSTPTGIVVYLLLKAILDQKFGITI